MMLERLTNSILAQNTVYMFLGQGARTLIQAVYFVVIARALGVEGYGAFIGAVALVLILAPFSSLGAGNILIKYVSTNNNTFGYYWGKALLMVLCSGAALTGVAVVTSMYILPDSIPLLLVVAVGLAELLFARILDLSTQAYQAFERLGRTAQLNVVSSFSRLIGALYLAVFVFPPTPVEWALIYLLTTAFSGLVGVGLVHLELGAPKLILSSVTTELKEGFYFAFSLSSQNIYNDIDKTMLARLSTLEAAGLYAAAYRLIDVAFIPVRSVLYAAYPRFFQHGARGIEGSLGFTKRLLPPAWVYALLAGGALYLTAPLLPYLLGEDYEGTTEALRWLSVLPLLKATHYLAADALTGAGFQGIRSGIQALVGVFNVLLNLWLISAYTWRGAAWASIASDTLLAVGLWTVAWYIYRKEDVLHCIAREDG